MSFTLEEAFILLGVVGLVVLLAWGTTIVEGLTKFNDRVGQKWQEQRRKNQQKNQQTDDDNT